MACEKARPPMACVPSSVKISPVGRLTSVAPQLLRQVLDKPKVHLCRPKIMPQCYCNWQSCGTFCSRSGRPSCACDILHVSQRLHRWLAWQRCVVRATAIARRCTLLPCWRCRPDRRCHSVHETGFSQAFIKSRLH